MILAAGGGGLSVAFDMPTLMGRDSDDSRSLGEVGHCGVAIDSAADMDLLFSGIDLGAVTTSMTISGPAVPIFCMYLVAAERQGVDVGTLNGTLQTDIFKEYIAQKGGSSSWPHLRLIGDMMEYCSREIPAYKPLSVSGYHIREAGSTAPKLAATLADGFGYVELGLSRGLDIERFAPGLSFFFDAHIDFFEEIAKFQAAGSGRLDARPVRREDSQGAVAAIPHRPPVCRSPRSSRTTTSYELQSRRWLPSSAERTRCTRTLWTRRWRSQPRSQQGTRALSRFWPKTGVVNVVDPLGGSWYVEALTDKIEAEAGVDPRSNRGTRRWLRSAARGRPDHFGPCSASKGWFTGQIADSAFRYQTELEKGDKKIVGVNVHTTT